MGENTPNLALYKPTPGSEVAWGNLINANWDLIDSILSRIVVESGAVYLVTNAKYVTDHWEREETGSPAAALRLNTDGTIDALTVAAGANPITWSYAQIMMNTLKVDDVYERTSGHGVSVDGSLVKDGAIKVDAINEKTAAAGVTIDGGTQVKDGKVTSHKLEIDNVYPLASDTTQHSDTSSVSVTTSTYTQKKTVTVPATYEAGTFRVKWTIQSPSEGYVYSRIYKNGVAYGSEQGTPAESGDNNYSGDVSASPGDTLEVWARRTGSTGYVKNFYVCCDECLDVLVPEAPTWS